jgi:putative FmdB family regulatory protein
MPTYEYRCKKGHTFEVMQRMSDPPVTKCQVCGAPVERVFHPIAIHFKGSGFYNTDYGTRKRSREKESADGATAAKDSSKTEAKDSGGSKSDSGGDSGGKPSKPTESASTASTSSSKSDG